MSPYQEFFERQRASLIREFADDMTRCLIATTPQRLTSHADLWKWQFVPLSGIRTPNAAWVLQKHSRDGKKFIPQLWVDVKYKGWRTAFRRFLREQHDWSEPSIPQRWHVDHLLPRSRFDKDAPDYVVRLYLLDCSVNTSYGGGFERQFYGREKSKRPVGGFHLDYITFLKAYGIPLPGVGVGSAAWARWVWSIAGELEEHGMDDRVANYHGISTVLNLGYTGRYSPLPLPPDLFVEAKRYLSFRCFPGLKEVRE